MVKNIAKTDARGEQGGRRREEVKYALIWKMRKRISSSESRFHALLQTKRVGKENDERAEMDVHRRTNSGIGSIELLANSRAPDAKPLKGGGGVSVLSCRVKR